MDILLSKYGLIFTELKVLTSASPLVNTVKFSNLTLKL